MNLNPLGKNVILLPLEEFKSTIELPEHVRKKYEAERGIYQATTVHAVGDECKKVKVGDSVLIRVMQVVPFNFEGKEYSLIDESLIIARLT